MGFDELLRRAEIEQSISCLRNRVIIDCGHVAVRAGDRGFSFGRYEGPSPATLQTFELGVALLRRLTSQGRDASLSICLSDTSRLLGDSTRRGELAAAIKERQWPTVLPPDYLHRLSHSELDKVTVILQTQGNNRFSKLLRKFMAKALRASSPGAFYRDYQSTLLTSLDRDRLAISTPFLMECKDECAYYGGTDWMRRDYIDREEDIIARPMTRLLRSGFINVYEKSTGVLCPGSYGGLLLKYDERGDHICIHSRRDDPHVGEKILRGVVAANVIRREMSRTFVQIVFPEMSETPEISLLSSARMKRCDMSWAAFLSALDSRGIFSDMALYAEQAKTGGAPA